MVSYWPFLHTQVYPRSPSSIALRRAILLRLGLRESLLRCFQLLLGGTTLLPQLNLVLELRSGDLDSLLEGAEDGLSLLDGGFLSGEQHALVSQALIDRYRTRGASASPAA
jgi:hypothetical protein